LRNQHRPHASQVPRDDSPLHPSRPAGTIHRDVVPCPDHESWQPMTPRPDPAARSRQKNKKARPKKPRLSRTHKPASMSLEDWQIELRRQFGREQKFTLVNAGDHAVFSTFRVTNPVSGNTYTVRIRGRHLGDNACTCPDFATNALGTCKHVEF